MIYVGIDPLSTNEPYLSGRLLWIGVSLGVMFAFLYYFPFPLSILAAIAAFVLLNFYLRKKIINRMNMIFDNPSSSNSSSSSFSLSYSCINCRTRHNEIACPRCGSKMKRADFYSF
jgi:uncharacterized paraquat-inducible protein A